MLAKLIAKGLLTWVPGMLTVVGPRGDGTKSAEYCYGVWLKHVTLLRQKGMCSLPKTIAELGPGASIGTGLAAVLSGADKYVALDVANLANANSNLAVFDELIAFFRDRVPRPTSGWPDFDAYLDDNLFPSHILTDEVLESTLSDRRLNSIRRAIVESSSGQSEITVKYVVPWENPHIIEKESIDLILSHSVLEHVSDLGKTYSALRSWLKPGGYMSHQIDFTSHGLARQWNGFRAYSEFTWKLIEGKRPFTINRQPLSAHLGLLVENGFEIVSTLRNDRLDGISRSRLSGKWSALSDDDLDCSGAFIIAKKL